MSGWNGALDNGKVVGKQACTAAAQLESLIETNERLAARVAELESAAIRVDFVNGVCEVNSDKLELDPARLWATGELYWNKMIGRMGAEAFQQLLEAKANAQPYRVKGVKNV